MFQTTGRVKLVLRIPGLKPGVIQIKSFQDFLLDVLFLICFFCQWQFAFCEFAAVAARG